MSDTKTTSNPADGKTGKKHAGGQLIIPIAGVLFAIYYFSTIMHSPWTAQVSAFFVGSILIALVLIFVVKMGWQVARGQVDLRFDDLIEPFGFVTKRMTLLALTLGYIIVIHYAGFTITTFAFLALSMLLLSNGRKKGFIISLSAILALAGWALFILAFHTRFPAGPFERMMEGLF